MTTATTIKCPSWCTADHSMEPAHHTQEGVDFGNASVDILEAIDDGSWLIPVPVGVYATLVLGGNQVDYDLTAVDCRQSAAALMKAADELDRINGATA